MKRVLTNKGRAVAIGVTLATCILWVVFVSGCEVHREPGKAPTYSVDPNKAAAVEGIAEAAITVSEALAVVWPGFAGVAGVLATALAGWRATAKKRVAEVANSERWKAGRDENFEAQQKYYTTAESLVRAVAAYRKKKPDNWPALKIALKGKVGPLSESVIREIRGLEPKP